MPRAEPEPLVLDMGHLVLHVKDLELSLGFYRDLLGFEVKDEEHRACCGRIRIGAGGGELVLFQSEEFVPLGLGPQGLGTPLHLHVEDFPKAARFLEEKGVRVHHKDPHGGTVFDPSGNAIALDDHPSAETNRRHRASTAAR
jgi:catechol 2,3-dioxygenase-like lactoylglutathione lyase family enzyme